MAIFDRFRRNRQQSALPDEVKEYYQTEKRQRRGAAILLGIGALLATIAVAAALFFGGRFIYNQIRGEDSSTEQTTSENKDQNDGSNNPEDAQTATPETPDTPPATSTPSNPETPTPTTTPSPAPTPAATPALGDTPLPHTGDEGM